MSEQVKQDAVELAKAAGFSPEWIATAERRYGRAVLADAVDAVHTCGFSQAGVMAFVAKAGPLSLAALVDALHEIQADGDPAALQTALHHLLRDVRQDVEAEAAKARGRWQRFVAWVKGLCHRG